MSGLLGFPFDSVIPSSDPSPRLTFRGLAQGLQ